MAKQRIDFNQPLSEGDVVELHFRSVGMTWIKAAQIALLEYQLGKRKDIWLKSVYCPDLDPTKVIITVKIINPEPTEPELQTAGIGLTCLALAGLVVTGGIVYKLAFEDSFLLLAGGAKVTAETVQTGVETFKEVVTSPEGKTALAGIGIALPLVAGVFLYKALK